jgi:hypothetical protein
MLLNNDREIVFQTSTRRYQRTQFFADSNIFRVAVPTQRILPDVFTDYPKLAFIAHDMFPEVSLPHSSAAPPKRAIHLNRRKRFKRPNDLAQS